MNSKQSQPRLSTRRKPPGPASTGRKKPQSSDDEKSSSNEDDAPASRSSRAGPASRKPDSKEVTKKAKKESSSSDEDSDDDNKAAKRPGPKSTQKASSKPGPKSAVARPRRGPISATKADSDEHNLSDSDDDRPPAPTKRLDPSHLFDSLTSGAKAAESDDESDKQSKLRTKGFGSAVVVLKRDAAPKASQKSDDNSEDDENDKPQTIAAGSQRRAVKTVGGFAPASSKEADKEKEDGNSIKLVRSRSAFKSIGGRAGPASKPGPKSSSKKESSDDDSDEPVHKKPELKSVAPSNKPGPKSVARKKDSSDDEEEDTPPKKVGPKSVTISSRPGPKSASKKDESSDDEEEYAPPKRVGPKSATSISKPGPKSATKKDESSDDEEDAPPKKAGPKSATSSSKPDAKSAAKKDESSDDEEDEVPPKKVGPKSATSSSKPGSKSVAKKDTSSDDEEDAPPKKVGPKSATLSSKPGPKSAAKKDESSDDEEDEPPPKKVGPKSATSSSKPGPKSAAKKDESSDDEEDAPPKKAGPKSATSSSKPDAKSAAKKDESSEEDEEKPSSKNVGLKSVTLSGKPGPKSAQKSATSEDSSEEDKPKHAAKKLQETKPASKRAREADSSSAEDTVKSTTKKSAPTSRSGPKSKKAAKETSDEDGEDDKKSSGRSTKDKEDLENMRIVCSSCGNQVNLNSTGKIFEHPMLGVLCCKRCLEFYESGNFTQDENGLDEYCRWCGEGGKLMCCDFCYHAFCEACLRRNLGRPYLSSACRLDKWHCLVCDKKPLADLQDLCKRVLERVQAPKASRSSFSRKSQSTAVRDVFQSPDSVEDPRKAMLVCVENVANGCLLVRDSVNKEAKRLKASDGGRDSVVTAGKKLLRWIKLSTENNATMSDMVRKQLRRQGIEDRGDQGSGSETTSVTSVGKKRDKGDDDGNKEGTKRVKLGESTSSSIQTSKPCRAATPRKLTKNGEDSKKSPSSDDKWLGKKYPDKQDDEEEEEESPSVPKASTSADPDRMVPDTAVKSGSSETVSDDKKKPDEQEEEEEKDEATLVDESTLAGDPDTDRDDNGDGGGGASGGGSGTVSKNVDAGDGDAEDKDGDAGENNYGGSDEGAKDVDEENVDADIDIDQNAEDVDSNTDDVEVTARQSSKPSTLNKNMKSTKDLHLLSGPSKRTGSRLSSPGAQASPYTDSKLSLVKKSKLSPTHANQKSGLLGEVIVGDDEINLTSTDCSSADKMEPLSSPPAESEDYESACDDLEDSLACYKTTAGGPYQQVLGNESGDHPHSEAVDGSDLISDEITFAEGDTLLLPVSAAPIFGHDRESEIEEDAQMIALPVDAVPKSAASIDGSKSLITKELLDMSIEDSDIDGEVETDYLGDRSGVTVGESPIVTPDSCESGANVESPASRAKRELLLQLESDSSDDCDANRSITSAVGTIESIVHKTSTPKPSLSNSRLKLKTRLPRERSGSATIKAYCNDKTGKSYLEMTVDEISDQKRSLPHKIKKKKRPVDGIRDRTDSRMMVVLDRLHLKNLYHALQHGVLLKPSKSGLEDDDSDSALDAELRRLADLRTLEKRRRAESVNEESDSETSVEEVMFEGRPNKTAAKASEKKKSTSILSSNDDSNDSTNSEDDDEEEKTGGQFNGAGEFLDDNVKSLNDRAKDMLTEMLDSSSDENSSSDSDEDSDDNASDSKRKNKSGKKKKVDVSADDDDDSEESKSGKKSRKRDPLLTDKLDSESDSDFATFIKKTKDKKKNRKRGRIGSGDSEEESDEDESDSGSRKRTTRRTRGKAKEAEAAVNSKKRRRRIKEVSDSSDDSDVQFVKRKKAKKDGSEEDEDDPDGQSKKGRKNIRKLIKDSKLRTDTKVAAKEEEDRRKRVEELQKKYNEVVGENERGVPITKKLVLAKCEESGDPMVEVHEDLIVKLKPHQVQGVKFLWESVCETVQRVNNNSGSGCILAHCMGLGKTLQVISFLHTILTSDKTNVITGLVVCPLNTVVNWYNECRMWLDEIDPSIEVNELSGVKTNPLRSKALNQWHEDGGIMIIGYEMFRNLVQEKQKKCTKYHKAIFIKSLIDPGPDVVVCDEGHILKNSNTALSKAMARIKTRRRIVLTGTPLQNNLTEYHCMVDFVKPNLLGTMKEFQNRFSHPISNGQCADSNAHDVRIMKKRAHILHNLLDGCVQRRDYNVLTPFLPPKYEYVINVRLTPAQVSLYSHYMLHFARKAGQGKSLFVDYQHLYRIWTHPWLLHMAEERQRLKDELRDLEKDDESFIDDTDDDESEPESDTGSNSGKEASTSKKKGAAKKKGRNDESSGDEVVKNWKTRRQQGLQEEEIEEILPLEVKDQSWWTEFVAKDEVEKIELSGKMVILLDLLKECEVIGDKILVFSQSLLTLNMIEGLLNVDAGEDVDKDGDGGRHRFNWLQGLDYFRLDGSTSAELRNRYTKSFNDPENYRARLFLISTRAGSLGINLVAANRVVMFDASWNPTHDVQSIFRVYRFGQDKPVYIYRLLAQGTMEEKIYDRQVTKQSLACRVVDEQQIERHFNFADLQELYSFEPDSSSKHPTPIIPKDRLLAELLIRRKDNIVGYHLHDSLLENKSEEELPEDERKVAWVEYETERSGLINTDGSSGFHVIPFTYCGSMNGSLRIDAASMIKSIIDSHPEFSLTDVSAAFRAMVEAMAKSRKEVMEKQEQDRQKILMQQRELFLQQQAQNIAIQQQQQKAYADQINHLAAMVAQGNGRPEDIQAQLQLQQAQLQRLHSVAANQQMMGMRHGVPGKMSGYQPYRHPMMPPGMMQGGVNFLNNLDQTRQLLAATGGINNITPANFQRQISNMTGNKGN